MATDKNKRRFKLLDPLREGKGVSKNAPELEPGIKKFFVLLKNNFGRLVSVNIFLVLGNFPIFFLITVLAGYTKNLTSIPMSDLFQNIFGLHSINQNFTPFEMSIYGVEGLQAALRVNTPITYVFYGISALTLLTFGCVNAGTAYILRNIVKGEPIFMWDDFFYAVKRNWKQALPMGIIDALICAILAYDIYYTVSGTADYFVSLLFWGTVAISVIWFFMRYYIYVQMVTFNLSIPKLIKNSFIFSLLGFKRNILAFLGIILVLLIEFFLIFGTGGILISVAVAAPLAIIFSLCAFMKVYASYFKIKEIMIDPYQNDLPKEPEPEVEVIMHDDVTERERIAEIKRRNGIADDDE